MGCTIQSWSMYLQQPTHHSATQSGLLDFPGLSLHVLLDMEVRADMTFTAEISITGLDTDVALCCKTSAAGRMTCISK